ncbi:hypothetical protein IMCC3135_03535 [Granulosicoccus antarcticus IMCC3135]|uniref:Uncharacterized protein n=2 Tax=Granulosicoccus TaxID=437504 RepID=A0A2Z2NPX1_9GAMM|nr:hypothetical protein IMCC3135_03535 [Granulosicoccus antarcticus IMCC3135]
MRATHIVFACLTSVSFASIHFAVIAEFLRLFILNLSGGCGCACVVAVLSVLAAYNELASAMEQVDAGLLARGADSLLQSVRDGIV